MESKSKVESEVLTKGIWVFSAEEKDKIRNYKEGIVSFRYSFMHGRWALLVQLTTDDNDPTDLQLGVYISALPQGEDYLNGTSKLAWQRGAGLLRICDLLSPADLPEVLPTVGGLVDRNFDSVGDSFGWMDFIKISEVQAALGKHDSLAIRFEFVAPVPQILISSDEKITLTYFDQVKHADLAFRFPLANGRPRFIFALKLLLTQKCSYFRILFNSGFAESTDSKTTDLQELSTSSALDRSLTYDSAELRPFYISSPQLQDPSGALADSPSQVHSSKNDANEDEKRPKEPKRSGADHDEEVPLRISFIEITETDFTTYRAMLAYFHTSLIPFTALPSDYLVARQAALADHDLDGAESFEFEEPEIWFSDASYELEGQKDWHGIQPCSPHSMFRLADYYEITELRELSKSRILRSLTVENVAYELFSPLSFDYDEIQEAVLEYFNDHWAEVRSTKALETVLEKFAAGELPEALDLVKKVWLAMVPEKKAGDAVDEKK